MKEAGMGVETVELPRVMSDLLELAVNETEKAAAQYNVTLDMTKWYVSYDGHCTVCMAGAVMLGLKMVRPGNAVCVPYECGVENNERLSAIDEMRGGCFYYAARILGINVVAESPQWLAICEATSIVDENVKGGWEQDYVPGKPCVAITAYRDAITQLRAAGL